MAIQTVNLGAPITGEGGDTYRDAHTKINANFSELNSKVIAVTQVTGQSTSLAVSQKLFTDTVGNINSVLDSINGVVV